MAPIVPVPHLIDLDEDSEDSIFNEDIADEHRIDHGVEGRCQASQDGTVFISETLPIDELYGAAI